MVKGNPTLYESNNVKGKFSSPGHGADIPERPPVPNDNPAVWDLVIQDMIDRDKLGTKRYGVRLQPFNGRDSLWDAYQEALDLVVYLRQTIFERDSEKMKKLEWNTNELETLLRQVEAGVITRNELRELFEKENKDGSKSE
jgi:hypothetical protein